MKTSYDRPVTGTLTMKLENGEEWEARWEDLKKLRLVEGSSAYYSLQHVLTDALEKAKWRGIEDDSLIADILAIFGLYLFSADFQDEKIKDTLALHVKNIVEASRAVQQQKITDAEAAAKKEKEAAKEATKETKAVAKPAPPKDKPAAN